MAKKKLQPKIGNFSALLHKQQEAQMINPIEKPGVYQEFDEYEQLHTKEEALHKLSGYTPQSSKDNTAKVLSSFIEYLPVHDKDGRSLIIVAILKKSDRELFDLAEYLTRAILLPLRASAGKTVTPSPFEEVDPDPLATATLQSTKQIQGTLKHQCLLRDDYRCMATGMYDPAVKYTVEQMEYRELNTFATQIIPFPTAQYNNEQERKAVSRIWADLFILFPELQHKFGPQQINDHRNVMTLWTPIHSCFGEFTLAFDPTHEDNEYIVNVFPKAPRGIFRDLPRPNEFGERRVKFISHDDRYPLPAKELLELHSAIANVLHASGMGDVIDKVLKDLDELKGLASDGSTDVKMLLSAFNLFQITSY
ncbi:hypothetical protein F5884DRAFT_831332 [Xylogone sp. PMI_703]|nr:hypothetical protein F5884DRAFT_831332 [Xylogone sp. PMI_703]